MKQVNDDLLRRTRKYVFDYFFENCKAPVLEEVMREFEFSRQEGDSLLRALEESHHILLLPGTQRILMANPFSGITTPFEDYIGGKRYFVNCAWDTISLHVMVNRETEVRAFCHHCAEPIKLKLREGKEISSEPQSPVIFLSVPVAKWYDNLINTCSNNMVYFVSEGHRDDWLALHPGLEGESLTVEKMAEACAPLSKTRMNLDYSRPSADQLVAYWVSIGLRLLEAVMRWPFHSPYLATLSTFRPLRSHIRETISNIALPPARIRPLVRTLPRVFLPVPIRKEFLAVIFARCL